MLECRHVCPTANPRSGLSRARCRKLMQILPKVFKDTSQISSHVSALIVRASGCGSLSLCRCCSNLFGGANRKRFLLVQRMAQVCPPFTVTVNSSQSVNQLLLRLLSIAMSGIRRAPPSSCSIAWFLSPIRAQRTFFFPSLRPI